MAILKPILYILVYPGLLFLLVYSTFCEWFDRKLYARMQNRIGPLHTGTVRHPAAGRRHHQAVRQGRHRAGKGRQAHVLGAARFRPGHRLHGGALPARLALRHGALVHFLSGRPDRRRLSADPADADLFPGRLAFDQLLLGHRRRARADHAVRLRDPAAAGPAQPGRAGRFLAHRWRSPSSSRTGRC